MQNYTWHDAQLRWRTNDEVPAAPQFISSPHDLDAQYAKQRSTSWIGYNVHMTETCEDQVPPLITHVETLAAPTDDRFAIGPTHAALEAKSLLPQVHVVDAGDAAATVALR